MKKLIQILLVFILGSIALLIIVFVFNPFNLRTKLIGNIVNAYLSSTITDYTAPKDGSDAKEPSAGTSNESVVKHPLLNDEQIKILEDYGVDVGSLPTSITPGMVACFVEKLGKDRAEEIVSGSTPTAMEILKSTTCLDK